MSSALIAAEAALILGQADIRSSRWRSSKPGTTLSQPALAEAKQTQAPTTPKTWERGLPARPALRLANALGTTAQLWLNLQNDYDVQIARRYLGKALRVPGTSVSPAPHPSDLVTKDTTHGGIGAHVAPNQSFQLQFWQFAAFR